MMHRGWNVTEGGPAGQGQNWNQGLTARSPSVAGPFNGPEGAALIIHVGRICKPAGRP